LAQRYPNVAELCNALYERELTNLASSNIQDPLVLKRKLNGLSYHIKNAAEFLLSGQTPIEVDVHNGSWKAKQSSRCPAVFKDLDAAKRKTEQWFTKHASRGGVVCVYVNDYGNQHVELDSIDILPTDSTKIHTNRFGWFARDGQYLDDNNELTKRHLHYSLIKPTKAILSAACAGHTWNTKGKTSPRTLTLRELLLSTNINWKAFK